MPWLMLGAVQGCRRMGTGSVAVGEWEYLSGCAERPFVVAVGIGVRSPQPSDRVRDEGQRLAIPLGMSGDSSSELQIAEEQPEVRVAQSIAMGDERAVEFEVLGHSW